jgi:hypothetical protein
MDDEKPSISPREFQLRSASELASADIDLPPVALAKSDERVALERQSPSRGIEPPDGRLVAVYSGSGEDVTRGFLIALGAMGVEQLPELTKPPVRGGKP